MLNFRQWITEGGNVIIGDASADRIDMTTLDRKKVVSIIGKGLQSISKKFASLTGLPLWSDELLKSNQFLSGSTLHLFDTNKIPDKDFVKYKPSVGDIDTQVDGNQAKQIEAFLKSMMIGEKIGDIIFLGYKPSGDQYITLWNVPELDINVQIDLELVSFQDGKPTPWSQFSHGSPWDDMKEGIKGVFHKYIWRAVQHRSARDILIQAKSARGKDKIIHSSDLAFSLKGMRYKIEPVLDDQGKHVIKDNMYVYRELDSKTAEYITDLNLIFTMSFDKNPVKDDIQKMKSFVGVIELINRYFNNNNKLKILNSFANLLWDKTAQGLVRGNPKEDYSTKIIAFNTLSSRLNVGNIEKYQLLINDYYKNYK